MNEPSWRNDWVETAGEDSAIGKLICEYPNALPPDLCQALMERFDYHAAHPNSDVRVEDKLESDGGIRKPDARPPKEASVIYLSRAGAVDADPEFATAVDLSRACLSTALNEYWAEVGRLLEMRMWPLQIRQMDFMRYQRGFGYYDAHVDAFRQATDWRVVSMIAYLNNVRSGGETEFTYLRRTVCPQAGKVLIFPSFYGCAHRSRLAETDNKYAIVAFVGFL
jgi:hypothetical protein